MDKYDVFISHASEDKNVIARPVAESLSNYGVRVWYDEFTLTLGDSLSRSIDKGLAESSFGLVILSPSFFAKNWPEYELRGLTAKEMRGKKVILPIWHNVSIDDVIKYSPPLADKLAVNTTKKSSDQIALEVIGIIRPDLLTKIHKRVAFLGSRKKAKIEKIEPAKVKLGLPKHKKLPSSLISRIRLIRAALIGVYTHSMKYWIDGFRGDSHPSEEIKWWEHVASCFLEYTRMTQLKNKEQYQTVFDVIFSIAMGDKKVDLKEKLKLLPNNAYATLTDMWKSMYPPYDFEEEFPNSGEMSEEDHQKWVDSLDIEDYDSLDKDLS